MGKAHIPQIRLLETSLPDRDTGKVKIPQFRVRPAQQIQDVPSRVARLPRGFASHVREYLPQSPLNILPATQTLCQPLPHRVENQTRLSLPDMVLGRRLEQRVSVKNSDLSGYDLPGDPLPIEAR